MLNYYLLLNRNIKLIIWTESDDSVMDGKKWEDFISQKLPLLTKFSYIKEKQAICSLQVLHLIGYSLYVSIYIICI